MIHNQAEALQAAAEHAAVSDSVRRAYEYFEQTGKYRREDLRTLLGDPNTGTVVGPGIRPSWAIGAPSPDQKP